MKQRWRFNPSTDVGPSIQGGCVITWINIDEPVIGSMGITHESSASEADARDRATLIAAAPDMLAALQGIFEHCSMIHKHWGEADNSKAADAAQNAARAAIAKALPA